MRLGLILLGHLGSGIYLKKRMYACQVWVRSDLGQVLILGSEKTSTYRPASTLHTHRLCFDFKIFSIPKGKSIIQMLLLVRNPERSLSINSQMFLLDIQTINHLFLYIISFNVVLECCL